MKVAFDTNLILRLLVDDDPIQTALARQTAREASQIIYSTVALCETVWTLRRFYKLDRAEIIGALTMLLDDPRAVTEWDAYRVAFAILQNGGDLADGFLAVEGGRMGAQTFATFDKDAARLLEAQGLSVTLLG